MTRERTVERRFRELAARHGGVAFKWESPGVAGVPDRILLLPGGRMFPCMSSTTRMSSIGPWLTSASRETHDGDETIRERDERAARLSEYYRTSDFLNETGVF